MSYVDPFVIPLDKITWEAIGHEKDPHARLLSKLRIGSLMMHLEAMAVTQDEDGVNEAVYPERVDDLEALEDMEGGSFTTLEIEGRDYVLVATPFCR